MQRLSLILTIGIICTLGLVAQERVRLQFQNVDAFVFDTTRLWSLHPSGNIMIGDSAGYYNYYDSAFQLGVRNVFIGNDAGKQNGAFSDNVYVGFEAGMQSAEGQNTFIGSYAGRINESVGNTFVGYSTGRFNTDGSANTFIGRYSGQANVDGGLNTFIGESAGQGNTSGSANAFFGRGAGTSNTSGNGNTYLGTQAGFYNTTGWGNVFIGADAGQYTNGFGNVIIGSQAGLSVTDSFNIIIGYAAGDSATGGQKLYIENSDANDPLIYGEFDNDILRINGQLQIADQYTFPTSVGANDQILMLDQNGQLGWVHEGDTEASNELINSVSLNFPFLEIIEAGQLHSVDVSTLIDDNDSDPTNEIQDLSIANDSILISSGAGIPIPAPVMLKDGDMDTKIELLENGLTDIVGITVDNVQILGIDYRSIQFFNNNNNVFVGGSVASGLNTGASNTFIGDEAGLNLTNGNSNTFLGKGAGASSVSSFGNTYLGYQAGPLVAADTGNVYIGYQAGNTIGGNNQLVIDNSGTSTPLIFGDFQSDYLKFSADMDVTGKVGVGTSNPQAQIHVLSSSSGGGKFETTSTEPVLSATAGYVGLSDVRAVEGISIPAEGYGYGGYFEGGYRGVHAHAEGGSSPYTVIGLNATATGPIGTDTRIGVFGAAANGAINWAGFFSQGNVHIANELRVGSTDGAAGYLVSVDGKITGEELKIQDSGDWPDYVFADNYNLMPLSEVEQIIKTHRHLPGIPSASEVEQEGILVGEMQKRMMEKIEELTLHVIALEKRIRELESEGTSR